MTREFFDGQMSRLLGLKFPPADMTTHWEGLRDMPEATLKKAISRSQRMCVDFPTPVELRQHADAIGSTVQPDEDRGVDLEAPVELGTLPTGTPIRATRMWVYYCDECSDQGMRSVWCGDGPSARYPWLPVRPCHGRNCAKVKYEHEWVERCVCFETNPALIKRREAQRKYAESPKKVA